VLAYTSRVALDYATLPNDPEELKQQLLRKAAQVEALMAEVLRLRRWRFGRSSEVMDVALAPELPLAGGEIHSLTTMPASDAPRSRSSSRLMRRARLASRGVAHAHYRPSCRA
jgi:hypothetical protein